MVHRNVVSWNCLIRGYVVNGRSEEALEVFDGMEKAEGGCEPNARTYVAAISACAALGARKSSEQKRWLDRGKAIHNQAVTSGNCGVFVKSALINMYAKCGSMADARRVFDEMSERDIISWNCLMQGYLENGLYQTVLEVFDGIHGCVPDARTYLAAISACVSLAERKDSKTWLEKGKDIFTRAAMNRCCDMFIESAMVDMYAKTDCMKDARSIFDGMARRDIVSWNSLLHGYVENREAKLALQLYDEIHDSVVPDERTYLAVVAACASLGSTDVDGRHKWLKRGRDIHCQAVKTRFCDIFVENTLVDMYAQCESMLEARQVFDSMALWNIVSWNCLVGGYVKNGENKMALEIISAMGSHGFAPDPATYIAAFMACGNSMDVVRGKEYHEKIRECGFEKDILVLTSLVEFYGNCGMIEVAKGIFDSMVVKDIWSWNALLSAYSQQGDTHSVLEVFKVMADRGTAPNEFTFTLILNACSHAGLTEKGKELFDSMEAKYGVKPDMIHYNCLVDLLGRANLLEEAVRFVRTMPFEGNAVTWGTILGACRKWNNVEVARVAYEALLKFDVRDSSTYVLMANICGNAGGSSYLTCK